MAQIDQNALDANYNAQQQAITQQHLNPPPVEPRGALGEIGTSLARGAMVGLPTLLGGALKYTSEPGQGVYEFGKGMVENAEQRGQRESLTLRPQEHGAVVNALAQGGEMLPSILPIIAGGAAASVLGAPALAATGVAALGGGALFGAEAGQRTLEKGRAAGLDENTAREAARLNAGVTMAGQAALGMVGGQMLGTLGKMVGPALGREGQALASGALSDLAGTSGTLMPFLKQMPLIAGEAVATNAAQSAASAEIERRYGADTVSPLDAALESIGPTLGMTALMGPMALVTRAMGVRSAKQRTESLASSESPAEIRTQLADQYAAQLAKADPQAAANFRANADVAIKNNMVLEVDSRLLDPNTVQAPTQEQTLQLGYTPTPMVGTPGGQVARNAAEMESYINGLPEEQRVAARAEMMGLGPQAAERAAEPAAPALAAPGTEAPRTYVFPDGSATNNLADVDAYINGLPEGQQVAARAQLLGFGAQPVQRPGAEAVALHDQIRASLQDAGLTPAAPLTRVEFAAQQDQMGKKAQDVTRAYRRYLESPSLQRDLMRRDADAFDALQAEPAPAAIPDAPRDTLAAQPEAAPEAGPQNRSMADALTAAFKKADEDRAYAERAATKTAETEAIANVTKGAEQAAAAEAGLIQGDPNAPKGREAIADDWKAAMVANDMDTKAQALAPFMKRLERDGVMDMATHQEQIDALQAIVDDKKTSQSVRDRASMLKEAWDKDMPAKVEEPAPVVPEQAVTPATIETPAPATAAVLGENIPPSAPETAAMPPKVEAVANSLESNLQSLGDVGVSRKADMIADRIAELRVAMNDRVRSGEKLSKLEQERMDDLGDFARLIDNYTEGKATPSNAQWVEDIAKMVDEASKPYTESYRMVIPGLKVADPETRDIGLLAPAMTSRKVADVMENLAVNGSEQWVRTLAARLQKLLPDTEIGLGMLRNSKDVEAGGLVLPEGVLAGEYIPKYNRIDIYPNGANEKTILHESVHAATAAAIFRAQEGKRPANQSEARVASAYKELEAIREEVSKHLNAIQADGEKHYGLTNIHEFVAELNSNPEFQDFLSNTGGRKNNLWTRVVEAVRKLLGLPPSETDVLARSMALSEQFFSDTQLNGLYDSSPTGMTKATDEALARGLAKVDRDTLAMDPGKVGLATLRGVLPLQTVSYIAGRVRAIPELVRSGFSTGIDAYQRANTSHEVVVNRLNDAGSKYIGQVEGMLRGMDSARATGIQREMMTIGGEASRIGFDYRLSGKDNLAADKTLNPSDKAYMDEIHRRFTQLQRTNPEAARLLEEGERLNLRSLTEKTATIVANLLDDYAGRARHLEAEISRMTPTDANYARRQDELRLATTEAVMAARHTRGLDLMDPSLAQGKNANPQRWADVNTSNLNGRLEAALRDARTLPENSALRNTLMAVESMYGAEAKHPYFSLGRGGDFFVKVGFKGIDKAANDRIQQAMQGTNKVVGDLTRGDSHAYFRVNSADEAQALHDRLVTAGQGKVVDTAWGRQAERVADVAAVSPALRTLLASVDDMRMDGLTSGLRDQVKQQITRQLLSMLPETASRNASMGRRGIPGYDGEFLKQFATRANGAVHDTAGTYTSRAYMAAATQREQAIRDLNRTGSADARQRAQLIDDEINKRYSNMLQPAGADWVNKATSLSHSFYLGLSPANFIRAVAQPWHRGIPFIGSKFGFAPAMAELAKGQAVGMKMVANSVAAATRKEGIRGLLNAPVELQNLGLSPAEQAWVNEAHANGKLGLGESSQLMRAATGQGGRLDDAMRYASANIQYAEMANRFGIGLAAFRLASKRPSLLGAGETPSTYALRAMENAMDDFSSANTARAIGKHGWAGKMTPLFTQFQNYNLQTMQQIARTVHEGFFGQDKTPDGLKRASEARREFAGLMATTATIAGAMGMPFANVFAGVYNTLMQDENNPEDVRIAMRKWAANTFGKEAGEVLMKGLPSLINLDSSTFGAQGILPGSEFLADRTLWKERSESQVRNSLGPAVSLGLDLTNAISKMSDGYWMKGIEAALPVGLRSFYKTGAMLAGDGYYTDSKGNPTPMPVTGQDIAWRALGFQTAAKATQGEAQRDFMINQQRLADRRKIIQDQFIKGTMDPAAMQTAGESLQAYNRANPLQPLTANDITGAITNYYTTNALGKASGMGIPVTKRAFPALMESAPFAAMPTR